MLRWGKGSAMLTCTGASGAPITPSSSLKSDRPQSSPDDDEETDGALPIWPFIQWPHPSFFPSPGARLSGSGPSMSGDSVSPTILMLPDLAMKGPPACCGAWWLRLRRRDIGEALLPLDLAGESPLTTSSFSAEKNPCFFSISLSLFHYYSSVRKQKRLLKKKKKKKKFVNEMRWKMGCLDDGGEMEIESELLKGEGEGK